MDTLISRTEHAGAGDVYYFSASTMRFFHGRVLPATLTELDADTFRFVTSERNDWGEPRKYSVRQAHFSRELRESDGREIERVTIDTVGEFQAYASSAQARKHLRDDVEAKS